MKVEWQETTLRKGTKNPKVCRDMFVSNGWGKWTLHKVNNGRERTRLELTEDQAHTIIANEKLIARASDFRGCYTYRTQASVELIENLLKTTRD